MTDPRDARLAAALRELGDRLDVPPAPDVRAAVLARLPARPRRAIPRWATVAAVLLLVFAAAVTLSPAVRATVTDLLRFAGIELRSQPGPAVRGQGLLPGERSVDLAEARRLVPFPIGVPAALGGPDDVRIADDPARVVSLLYQTEPGRPPAAVEPVAVRLDEFDGRLGPVFEKFLGMSGGQRVSVTGAPAIWLDRPHELIYVDRAGQWRTETARLAAQSLIWQRGTVTYRLEGAFTLEDALRIAATVS
ncbi:MULTISPECIES: hypothetical protein [unclassified Amycolatopsis]|uniref:hypothetical protein n=1 Tax=unclassified Amycolatopsis TaxID=2618356 RepID=UPI00287662FB|nr:MULTISPECIES: hypothetical protein [unclassified Amycolatopsis]MDS0139418.1 hypothetical protein [Amycolatopsis sp. 505]MDS0146997.1 hypothetical protein [Amycolatopsis sp. CM201R]